MKKYDMLPIIAAFVIAILVLPTLALPVNAATPIISTTYPALASVVTIPEDNAKMNMGTMVLGLTPTTSTLDGTYYTESTCTTSALGTPVGPVLSSEPLGPVTTLTTPGNTITVYQKTFVGAAVVCTAVTYAIPWPALLKGYGAGYDLLSQHKILATLNGVPTKPDFLLCEVVEKEKAKIPPMSSKTPSLRQFPDEIIKTTLIDVTSDFICKVNWIKPGVGALDVYFVGPHVSNFIADHMLIVTAGYKVGTKTIWASDLQDICILGWAMDDNVLQIWLFSNPGLSSFGKQDELYYSWPNPMGPFDSCDEAAAWQLAWIFGGWPYATATS